MKLISLGRNGKSDVMSASFSQFTNVVIVTASADDVCVAPCFLTVSCVFALSRVIAANLHVRLPGLGLGLASTPSLRVLASCDRLPPGPMRAIL